ncbi:DUF222 domain-containing protein [Rathayibacter sp. KR2-224]|uniref:HNH endonuclease signature motif containing protein n=1 Tax=Rathayibacter sp. KR2-224 TaxID=3400913 RepID=UPI003C0FE8A9
MYEPDVIVSAEVEEVPWWEDPELPSSAAEMACSAALVSAEVVLGFVLGDAVGSQTVVYQQAARQVFAIRDAFQIARQNPRIYVPVGMRDRDPRVDEVDFAQRSVAFDLAQRLQVSENVVRSMAFQGEVLSASLPGLCGLFMAGLISPQHARAAVEASVGLPDRAAFEAFDAKLTGIAERVRAGEFARRCRLLRERLCADTVQERHQEAVRCRRVVVEPAEDAMAWLHLYGPIVQIAQAEAALTAAARRLHAREGESRTLDQLRADLALHFLTANGGAGAGSTGGTGSSAGVSGRSGTGGSAGNGVQPVVLMDADGRFAELLGYGPIPAQTAGRVLRDAPAFRKVVADPGSPAGLNLDARRYRPTPDQKRWLTIRYGLDDDAAPYLATGVTSGGEIDHVVEWQHGGTTEVTNLVPLKPRLHRLKTVTRIRIDPKPDGGIRVRTPTGHDTDPPPF